MQCWHANTAFTNNTRYLLRSKFLFEKQLTLARLQYDSSREHVPPKINFFFLIVQVHTQTCTLELVSWSFYPIDILPFPDFQSFYKCRVILLEPTNTPETKVTQINKIGYIALCKISGYQKTIMQPNDQGGCLFF